jgi:hypothetical protein
MLKWIKEVLLEQEQNISAGDIDLMILVDTAEEAVAEINKFYKKHILSPNF